MAMIIVKISPVYGGDVFFVKSQFSRGCFNLNTYPNHLSSPHDLFLYQHRQMALGVALLLNACAFYTKRIIVGTIVTETVYKLVTI